MDSIATEWIFYSPKHQIAGAGHDGTFSGVALGAVKGPWIT